MSYIRRIKEYLSPEMLQEMWIQWKWIFIYTKRYTKEILFFIVFGLIGALLSLAATVAGKYLIDALTGTDTAALWRIAIIVVTLALLGVLLSSVRSRISAKIGIRINNDIQADIFERIMNVNWMSLNRFHSGDLLNRFTRDVSVVATGAISLIPTFIVSGGSFLAQLGVMLYYDKIMALIALISAPVMIVSSKFLTEKMRDHNKAMKTWNSNLMAFEDEAFFNIDTIKAFGIAKRFSRQLREMQEKLKKTVLDYNLFSVMANVLLSILALIIEYSCLGWGIYRLWQGIITYGTLVLFIRMSSRLSGEFSSLVSIIPTAVDAANSAGRIMEIINQPSEMDGLEPESEADIAQKDCMSVEIKEISFGYDEDSHVFDASSLTAKAGEIVAVVGPSGKGKTTLIRLILGLVAPHEGTAHIRDSEGNTFPLSASTRSMFAYVPQGNTIFSGSIRDNLLMVKDNATEEQMLNALKIACADEFVAELPGALDFQLGQRGKGLSEGQAQRIAIARAVLRDAPVLLLDEASSALDMATERRVMENLLKYRADKVCIVTTHRASMLDLCQRVYSISGKTITEIEDMASARKLMES